MSSDGQQVATRVDPLFSLDGRSVLVTGAASGIGFEIAANALRRGAVVYAWDRNEGALATALARFGNRDSVVADVVDVTAVDQVDAGIRRIGDCPDVLVNSAGLTSRRRRAEATPLTTWDRYAKINLIGCENMCLRVGVTMAARGNGCIVNLTSVSGLDPGRGIGPYAITKRAIIQLTKCLSLEWAPRGVRVNALAPGPVETEGTLPVLSDTAIRAEWQEAVAMNRIAEPHDIAGLAIYLMTEASSWATGQTFVVDGGWLLGRGSQTSDASVAAASRSPHNSP